jgi:hypothetical protein
VEVLVTQVYTGLVMLPEVCQVPEQVPASSMVTVIVLIAASAGAAIARASIVPATARVVPRLKRIIVGS